MAELEEDSCIGLHSAKTGGTNVAVSFNTPVFVYECPWSVATRAQFLVSHTLFGG
jgi:hypothetical protein